MASDAQEMQDMAREAGYDACDVIDYACSGNEKPYKNPPIRNMEAYVKALFNRVSALEEELKGFKEEVRGHPWN